MYCGYSNPVSVNSKKRVIKKSRLSHKKYDLKHSCFVYFCRSPDQENTIGGAPENLTFKERQRLFSQGKEVSNKVKASRKLMELENELNVKQ